MNHSRILSIKRLIEERGRISLNELTRRFPEVSSMTVRRDLQALENEGILIRVRGGAVSVKELNKNVEDMYSQRAISNTELKKEIAVKAVEFAERGHSIFIDSGSTTLFFAKELPDLNYYVTTNGINIAFELSRKAMPVVNMIGGVISKNNLSASGSLSQMFLDNVNVDIAFMACSGFTPENGFMCGHMNENEFKNNVVKKARKRVMLMDTTKVNRSMPFTFSTLDDIDVLITDSSLSNEMKQEIKNRAPNILIV
ncbi:MAG: DeoR/GlpR transcriptional regulator [Clostridia bacterium]|nr:DeoR/GlpR transcriptional regulator [Clostridia bacterium]